MSLWGFYIATVRGVPSDLLNRESLVTQWVVLGICVVFLVQEAVAVMLGASVLGVTSYFFLHYPVLAWVFSFFLHRDVFHFSANVVLIGFTGRLMEGYFSTRSYLWFIVVTAIVSGFGAYLFRAPFTSQPVAAYGASGFGFAVAVYSLYVPFQGGQGVLESFEVGNLVVNTSPGERFAFVLGVAAVLKVVYNLLTGPYFTVEWANGAHFVGVVVGLVVGVVCSPVKD